MSLTLPAVRAVLHERFLFNFRMPPGAIAAYLPTPWLQPQTVNGFGIVSFCLLDLRHITVAPLPAIVGLRSISCAPRYAVLDDTGTTPTPAVFVTERQTNNAFGAWFTTLGFSCHHPYVQAKIVHGPAHTQLDLRRPGHDFRFAASVRPAKATSSRMFDSADDFAAFIAQGVTSYGLSRYEHQLTKVDLHKEDHGYEPLDVLSVDSTLLDQWQADGAVFDSAFRTAGGRYEWTYYGLTA